ncbi:MAG: LPS export ABC transporter permease LptF [Gammaproteobacteria bacterium]|nr:LPS export ABC transporter permease LptF [Gammaproteobacteria bacterium]
MRLLPIIDRYILLEVTKYFLGSVLILLMALMGSGFIKLLGQAAAGALSNEVLLELAFIETLRMLGPVTPPAFFLAIMATLVRMYRDSEMTALSASGVGGLRIYRAVVVAALPVTLLVGWLTLDLQPMANQMKRDIIVQQSNRAEFSNAVAGRFNEFSRGDLVVYVESMSDDKSRLQNVFVQNRQHGKLGLISAAEGYQYLDEETGEHFVVLLDGRRYEGVPGRRDFTLAEFKKYSMRLDLQSKARKHLRADELPTSLLLGASDLRMRAELEYRMLIPVAVLVFTIVSVPLSYSLPRDGMTGRMILALLLYFTFINLFAVSGKLMENGTTPEWLGRWWVHLVMLSMAGAIAVMRIPTLRRRFLPGWGNRSK